MNNLSFQTNGNLDITSLVKSNNEENNPTIQHNILSTGKCEIIHQKPDLKSWNKALVLGRAGNSSAKNKIWFNLEYLTDSHDNIQIYTTSKRNRV